MKVYILAKEPFPNGMAATNRIICYAKAIISQNIECEVVLYVRTESQGNERGNSIAKGVFENVPYRYVGGKSQRSNISVIDKLNTFFDALYLLKYLKSNLKKKDVVYVYNDSLGFSSIIIKIAHFKKAFVCSELCELPYATTVETKKTIRQRRWTQSHLFPQYDGIIAISDNLVDYAKHYVTSRCKILKIPILVDMNKYALDDKSDEAEMPYIFHIGTLTQQKDGLINTIIAFGEAVRCINFPVCFISTGNLNQSIHYKEIESLINKYNLFDKIKFTGYLKTEELKTYLEKASFVIINKLDTQQNQYCFPTKLGEYMAAAKPIINTNIGEAASWLHDGYDSCIIPQNDIDALKQSIIKMFTDSIYRKQLSKNAVQTCKRSFDYTNYGAKIVSFFRSLNLK